MEGHRDAAECRYPAERCQAVQRVTVCHQQTMEPPSAEWKCDRFTRGGCLLSTPHADKCLSVKSCILKEAWFFCLACYYCKDFFFKMACITYVWAKTLTENLARAARHFCVFRVARARHSYVLSFNHLISLYQMQVVSPPPPPKKKKNHYGQRSFSFQGPCTRTISNMTVLRPSATWRYWDHQQHDGTEAISNMTVLKPSATWRYRGHQQHDGTGAISNRTVQRLSATWRYWGHQQHDGTGAISNMTVLGPSATWRYGCHQQQDGTKAISNVTVPRSSATLWYRGHQQRDGTQAISNVTALMPSATWRYGGHQQRDGTETISNKTVQRPSAMWRYRGHQQRDGTEAITNVTVQRPSPTWRYRGIFEKPVHVPVDRYWECDLWLAPVLFHVWPRRMSHEDWEWNTLTSSKQHWDWCNVGTGKESNPCFWVSR